MVYPQARSRRAIINGCTPLLSSLPSQFSISCLGNPIKMSLTVSISAVKIISHKCAQHPISQVTLDSVRLTINTILGAQKVSLQLAAISPEWPRIIEEEARKAMDSQIPLIHGQSVSSSGNFVLSLNIIYSNVAVRQKIKKRKIETGGCRDSPETMNGCCSSKGLLVPKTPTSQLTPAPGDHIHSSDSLGHI